MKKNVILNNNEPVEGDEWLLGDSAWSDSHPMRPVPAVSVAHYIFHN